MIKMLMSHLLPSSVIKKKKLSIAFVLIFALLSITSSASAEGLAVFASPNHLGTGSGPNAIVIADFNRDGKRDIATANRYSDNISILLSTGTGSYNPAVNYAVAASPVGILAADFNGDGKTDLAAAGASISVLLGNGDGTFRAAANYAAGDAPAAIAVGDFNRDGKPDLAVANGGSGNVSILLGNGDATFQTAITYASGNAPSSIAIGDINGDGSLDLVVTNENDATISILNGNGNGTFQAAATTSVRSGPRAVAIVDFDSDGKLDLLVASYGSGWVSHLKGNGNGTFQTILNNGVGNYPTFLATGDFNGDGNVDYIVTRDVSLYNAMIYYGNGKGGTLPWGNGLQVENNGVVAAVADDLNGDGKTDIVVAYAASNKIAVAMNTTVLEPSGTFLVQSEIYPYIYSEAITAADFNKDGSLDLVVADYNDNVHNISLLSGTGDGTFSASITASAAYRSGVATGDFNRDGKIDLAVAHGSNNNISVRFGVGDGTFQPSVYYAAGSYCRALLSTDVNGDGIADLAVANSGSNDVSILLGKEDGSFLAAVSYGAGAGPFDVIARDFDRDGKIDLLVANRGSNAVSVLIGNGDGTFQATAPYVTANAPTAITVGDFNGDGKLDLAAASSYAADVSILMGNGDGTLGPHTDYIAANSSLESIVTGDFNRDGKLDLAVTSSSAHELSILQGNGDGTFTRGQDMVWGSNYIRRLTAGDFDKDGRIDLAVTSDDGVMILINADVTPDVFYLYSVTNAERNAEVTSLSITVSGINTSVPISITGGWYSVSTDGGLSFSPYSTTTPSTVTAGDVVRVKQLSSPNFSTMTTTKLTISGKSADFQVTTRAARTTPYPFSFVDQVGVTTSTLVTSNSIIVVGIEAPATIYISGGEYEINGNGMWSSASGTVANNDTVRVRQVSSPLDGTRTDTAVTIGGVSDTFSITTFVPDDQFVFIDQTNVMLSTLITSNSIIVTGISMPTSVAITNGEYEVNGSGVWSSASGTVVYNDVLRVRQVSSPVGGTRTDTTLTIGGVSDTFSVTTLVPDTIPDPFAFAGQTNVTVDTLITSNSITVSGLEAAAPVTITDGEYAGVAVDSHGNIYIADTNNNRVRKVDATTGVITTVAGTGSSGYYGNNLPATSAWLSAPRGIALDSAGNIYIADTNNYRIRKVNVTTGVITAVAGSGAYGYFGDNGSATSTGLASPRGLAVDGSGNIYIADTNDNRIRKVDATTGVITTVAGNGASGYSGDNVAATSAAIYMPFGVSVTISGDIYIADTYNHRIRKVDAITGLITTIAGSGTFGFAGDYGPATAANINNPSGVAFDSTGNVYIADMSNSRIRKIVAYDTMPDSFSFIAQTSIAVNTQVMSNTITVTGINSAVAISIAGGEYEVNGSGIWTSATGTVNNGYSVRVRQTSSQNYSTTTTASLTIGSVSAVFNVTTLVPVSSVTLTASPASPRLVNTPVTFTATATGGETSKEYQFAVKDPVSGVMTVLQQYGPSNTFPYTPTAAGTYTIRVYVRNVGSPVSYEAARWFTDSAVTSSPVTTVTLAASPAGPRLVNTPATFTATATGGGESKEYQFAVKDPVSGVMTVIQPYGPSNTFPYTPTAAGMYTIRVYARNVGSPASYEAVQWFTDNVVTSSPVTSVTLAASPAGPRLVNTPVTFTATATGGGTSKEYQFAVKDPASGVMTVLQPYGPSNTFPYTPTDAGTYSIRVYVRNEGSAAVYEAVQWLTDNVLASAPVTRATLSASPLSPRLVNTPVTFTATATDGGESKEYQFAVKDPVSGVMTVIQPYGPSNTFPYTPTNAGTYSIRVYVRNVGSEASFEAARWLTDVVTP